jgi:hypothetical protein
LEALVFPNGGANPGSGAISAPVVLRLVSQPTPWLLIEARADAAEPGSVVPLMESIL